MPISPLFSVFKAHDPRGFFQIFRDWRSLLRLHFLHAALDAGLLRALERPRSREELIRDLGVERADLLDAILELGVSVGELRLRKGRYLLRGSRSRSLSREENDALAAIIEANVTYYNAAFQDFSRRLRGGPLGEGVGEIGPLVARASRVAEPYVQHFLKTVAKSRQPRRVLDVGCGSGVNLRTVLLELPSATGTGLELDPAVVSQAEGNLERWGIADRGRVLQGDLLALPDELRGPFQLALLFSLIYYFDGEERITALRAVRERLDEGGALALTTNCRGPEVDPFSANLNLVTASMHGLTSLPTPEEMDAQLREAGYSSISLTRLIPGTTYFGFLAS